MGVRFRCFVGVDLSSSQILATDSASGMELPGGPLPLLCSRAHAGVVLSPPLSPHSDTHSHSLLRACLPLLYASLCEADRQEILGGWDGFPRRCPCPGSVPWSAAGWPAAGGMAYSVVRLALRWRKAGGFLPHSSLVFSSLR